MLDDFDVNFSTVNLPYVEEKLAPPQSEKIWYSYLIVYEGQELLGRDFKSYDHIITFRDIEIFEEEKEREVRRTDINETFIVTNIVLLSTERKDWEKKEEWKSIDK